MALNPATTFPEGTFERFLVDTIGKLDLSDFENVKDDQGGEASYDPRSLLGIIFYGFCRGTFSSRKLSIACLHDSSFMFVSGFATPEHSTICRFIITHKQAIISLFAQVLYIADNMKLVDYTMIAIDGTKIKANASKQFNGTLDDFRKKEGKLQGQIKRLSRNRNALKTKTIESTGRQSTSAILKVATRYRRFLKLPRKREMTTAASVAKI